MFFMTKCRDKIRIGSDVLEALSNGRRGFISGRRGSFKLDAGRWQQYVDRVTHGAGVNSIAVLSMAPWESTGTDDLLAPFQLDGQLYDLRKIDPAWQAILEQLIRSALEVEPNNLTLRLHLFDNCQFHHGSVNPYLWTTGGSRRCMNTGGWRHFFDVPWAVNLVYVDAMLEITRKFPGKIQLKVGNELTARTQKMTTVPGTRLPLLPDALYVYRLAEYLVAQGFDRRDLGWGCTYGLQNIGVVKGKLDVLQPDKSLQTHVNRIAERADKAWNLVHREVHGLGAWDGKAVGIDTQLFAAWYSDAHAGVGDGSTDGADAGASPWASVRDRLVDAAGRVLYARYNAEATRRSMDYVLAKCGKKDTWLAVLPQNLEDEAYMENACALVASYERRFKVPAWNRGSTWPKPAPQDPSAPSDPPPAPAQVPWWSWARICNVRRWTWQAWLAVIALISLAYLALRAIF